MCVVSMVTQHYFDRWPQPNMLPYYIYPDMAELIRKARLYDIMTNQPDCPDLEKAKWLEEVQKLNEGKVQVLTSS